MGLKMKRKKSDCEISAYFPNPKLEEYTLNAYQRGANEKMMKGRGTKKYK